MTIIAQALAKQNPAHGGPEGNASASPMPAEGPAKNAAGVYPVSSILRLAHGRAPQPGAMPLRWTPAPARPQSSIADESTARPRASIGAMAFGAVALLAVVVGFLANTGGETPESGSEPRGEAAIAVAGISESAVHPEASEPAAEAAPEAAAAIVSVTPAPTPITVRLEVQRVAPSLSAPRGSSIIEDTRDELPLVPYETSSERDYAARAPRTTAKRAKAAPSDRHETEDEAIEDEEEGYKLSGIFWDEKKPAALINDEIVEVGDVLGDMTVKAIRRTSVEIEVAGKRQLLAF